MILRKLKPVFSESFLLFGARGTGKSTLLEQWFGEKEVLKFDLLDSFTLDRFRRDPSSLEREVKGLKQKPEFVLIDEIQKSPALLDVCHRLIEKHKIKVGLTGSSARKLRRGAGNLLAGRALIYHLFPFVTEEIVGDRKGYEWSVLELQKILSWGTLPKAHLQEDERARLLYLRSYALSYIKEEIQEEQLLRKIEPFRAFLDVSAQMNGKLLNFLKIAKEVDVDPKTIASYYQILEDTWMGLRLPHFDRSIRKSQYSTPKFYWFDLGVKRALENTLDMIPAPSTSYFGELFEHFLILEFFRMNQYCETGYQLSYFASADGVEIDLLLSRGRRNPIAIEIKSATKKDVSRIKKFSALAKEVRAQRAYYLSLDPIAEVVDGVRCVPWYQGIREIFYPKDSI